MDTSIVDVGGAAGAYAFWLTEKGHAVHLVDAMPLHVEQAKQNAAKRGVELESYTVADARALPQADQSADVVLLFGPLYHLLEEHERLQAFREAYRLLKPGGLMLGTAITRFASYMDGINRELYFDPGFAQIVAHDLKTGQHRSDDPKYFTNAYFHHPSELRHEAQQTGFLNVTLHAIEGPAWHEPTLNRFYERPEIWQQILEVLDGMEQNESIMGASSHIMVMGRK